jgi:hypothetical protein
LAFRRRSAAFVRRWRALAPCRAQGREDDATQLLGVAASQCPKNYDERFAAGAELRAVGASR